MCRKILKMVCVFAEDEDNMQLVSTETSSSKKCESLLADENSGSPEVLASDGTAFVSLADNTGDRQHSVQGCVCVENTSALSPTRVTHCLLNSVMSSSVQVEIMNKHHASRVSDRTQGLFMAFTINCFIELHCHVFNINVLGRGVRRERCPFHQE